MSHIEQALEKAARERKLSTLERSGHEEKSESAVLTLSNLTGVDPRIISLLSPSSGASEQFKRLRTHLLRFRKLYSHNCFLITSSLPNEGKTTTSMCVAISIAQGLNETVLVIDSDMRRPSIHKALGLSSQEGLSSFLSKRNVALSSVISRTKIEKLSVITAGSIPPNPVELISSDKMTALIAEVKARYSNRIIIIDSPPVLTLTDTIVLGHKTDGVLMVVRAGKTPKEAVNEALNNLKETNVIGVALNLVSEVPKYYYGKGGYGGYGSYGYGNYGYGSYGYGQGRDDERGGY